MTYMGDKWHRRYRRYSEIRDKGDTGDREIQEIPEIDGGEGFAPQFRRKAGTPDVWVKNGGSKWGEALSSGLGFENGTKPSPPDRVSEICRGMKSQIWVKNGGSTFPTLGGSCIEARPVLSKKWSPGILNNIDLSSYTRFGIWGGDFMLRSHHFWWTMSKREKFSSFLESIQECLRIILELF